MNKSKNNMRYILYIQSKMNKAPQKRRGGAEGAAAQEGLTGTELREGSGLLCGVRVRLAANAFRQ